MSLVVYIPAFALALSFGAVAWMYDKWYTKTPKDGKDGKDGSPGDKGSLGVSYQYRCGAWRGKRIFARRRARRHVRITAAAVFSAAGSADISAAARLEAAAAATSAPDPSRGRARVPPKQQQQQQKQDEKPRWKH
jgi:hypothetical protein